MKEYFENLLRLMVENKASDLHIKTNAPPILRIHEKLTPLENYPKHTSSQIREIAQSIIPSDKWEYFRSERELDTAYSLTGVGRFRLNMFVQRNSIVIVTRAISLKVPKFDTLGLPPAVKTMAEKSRGLILVTGTTGSGKSTTLASLVDHINSTRSVHIITVEDPIEYLHQDRLSIINQREVGQDTKTFATALRYLLRQDPDVILIGEIRDSATMEVALSAADTGHLVFSTLHTTDARQSIERILSFYPLDQGHTVRLNLSLNLVGVVSQRLLPRKRKAGLIPAVEIMVNSERIKKAISENQIYELTKYISEGEIYGMQTFNQSLYKLVKDNEITEEIALTASSSPEELRMLMKGIIPSVDLTSKTLTSSMVMPKKVTKEIVVENYIPYPGEEEEITPEPESVPSKTNASTKASEAAKANVSARPPLQKTMPHKIAEEIIETPPPDEEELEKLSASSLTFLANLRKDAPVKGKK